MVRRLMGEEQLDAEDVRRLTEEVRNHKRRKALGGLAFDVLSRQAEGQALVTGRKFVRSRAKQHRVRQEHAKTEFGNLVTFLERGPESPRQHGLIAAFAVSGFGDRFEQSSEEQGRELLDRFVRHADWLEVATRYAVYPFVDSLLPAHVAKGVWERLGDQVLQEEGQDASRRGYNAARLTALGRASPQADEARRRVLEQLEDGPTRTFARAMFDQGQQESSQTPEPEPEFDSAMTLSGRMGRAPRVSLTHVLRLVTGLALLQWLLRGLGKVVGFSRELELELIPSGVRVQRRTRLLGRLVRESRETHAWAAVAGAERRVRYPALPYLVGLLAFSVGALMGGLFAFDALRTGETVLLLIAAGLVLGGAGLDLALSVLWPARSGSVAFELRLLPKRGLGMIGVPFPQADRFLEELERRLVPEGAQPSGGRMISSGSGVSVASEERSSPPASELSEPEESPSAPLGRSRTRVTTSST